MSDSPEGKDGVMRVIARYKKGSNLQEKYLRPYREDWYGEPWNSHHWMDVYVEQERMDNETRDLSYFRGHRRAFEHIGFTIVTITLSVLLYLHW